VNGLKTIKVREIPIFSYYEITYPPRSLLLSNLRVPCHPTVLELSFPIDFASPTIKDINIVTFKTVTELLDISGIKKIKIGPAGIRLYRVKGYFSIK